MTNNDENWTSGHSFSGTTFPPPCLITDNQRCLLNVNWEKTNEPSSPEQLNGDSCEMDRMRSVTQDKNLNSKIKRWAILLQVSQIVAKPCSVSPS